jgi:hypothetical protein
MGKDKRTTDELDGKSGNTGKTLGGVGYAVMANSAV